MTPVVDLNTYRSQKALVMLSLTSPARPDVYAKRNDPKPGPIQPPLQDRPAA